jgi:hypothetical protein
VIRWDRYPHWEPICRRGGSGYRTILIRWLNAFRVCAPAPNIAVDRPITNCYKHTMARSLLHAAAGKVSLELRGGEGASVIKNW